MGITGLVLAIQTSVAGAFASSGPAIALKFAPFNAGARAKLAEQIGGSEQGQKVANELASDAIRRDPLQPVALRILAQGLDSQTPASQERAAALMSEAQRLSRRDTLTQLWFIQRNGARGKGAAMMQHFDIALRASISARPNLFPFLVTASTDPTVRVVLIRTLSARPGWEKAFATYAVREGRDLGLAAELAPRLLDARQPDDRVLYQDLLNRLVQAGRYDVAWNVYQATGAMPKDSRAPLRGGNFEGPDAFPPFDWWFSEEPDLFASREHASGGGLLLRVAASDDQSGEAARQLVRLAPGIYQLSARMGDLPNDPAEWPTLRIRCAPDDQLRLVSIRPSGAGTAARQVNGRFEVPDKCHFQWLTIDLAGDGPPQEIAAWVDDIAIVRTH